jgi:biopolymer transport protein ExbB
MGPDTVSVENPYGLGALWAQGDFVAKGTLILLALMSAYSWFIIFTKWWEQRRLLRQAREVEKAFWQAENIKAGVSKLTGKGNVFKGIASEAIDAAEHHDERLTQQVPLHEWIDNVMARAVGRIGNALSTQLPFLATTGSTAPFIGLFGTVWGIYHALLGISAGGISTLDKVAGPVGEALIMTAAGLAVAIPAVLAYNSLTRANRLIVAELDGFAHDLHTYLTTGSKVDLDGAPGVPRIPARPAQAQPAGARA